MAAAPEINDHYDTIILGAGPAGIGAARTLLAHGKTDFLVLEGRDRIGGRTYTHPVYQDLGAAWNHINDPRLAAGGTHEENREAIEKHLIDAARSRGFTLSFDDQNSRIYLNGERIERDRFLAYVDEALQQMEQLVAQHGDMSAAEALDRLEKKDALLAWVVHTEFGWGSTGRDIDSSSVEASLKQFSLASGVLYKEGLGNLFQELGKELLPHTALNMRVTAIHTREGQGSEIEFTDPSGGTRTVYAKHVISTIPPSVYNHTGDAYAIRQNFPQCKKDALKALPSGAMNKIILDLEPGYLASVKVGENQHYEVMHPELGNLFCLARPAGRDVLVAFVGGEASIALEHQGKDAAVAYAMKFLSTVPEFKDLPRHIKGTHFTNWHTDPFARGAYSTPVVGATDAREKAAEPLGDSLFFAGEAFATNGWQTQVYGAYETGIRAARDVIAALDKTPDLASTLHTVPTLRIAVPRPLELGGVAIKTPGPAAQWVRN